MKRVTKSNPCPVCGKPDWCYLSDNKEIAFCTRVESHRSAKGGAWMHFLKERDLSAPPQRRTFPPVPVRPSMFDAKRYHACIRKEWDHVWCDGLAVSLGVNCEDVERLEPGWDDFNKAVGFPMRDAEGNVIGIRLRNFVGKKWAVAGSKDGLFFDTGLQVGEAKELVVCEGPTDTAAAYSLGLPAVGRSSCGTGMDLLKALCSRLGVRLVTIVADADEPKARPDGSTWRPGIDGAVRLGAKLGRIYRVVVPPKKDLREWVGFGCTLKEWTSWVGNTQIRRSA